MIPPGETLGIIGGGQLGRMTAMAARHLGYRVVVLADRDDAPAAPVADRVFHPWDDPKQVEAFAASCAVATLEFENVPLATAESVAARIPLRPGVELLAMTQRRSAEKSRLREIGAPTCDFVPVADPATFALSGAEIPDGPWLVKTDHGGYDGKGQFLCRHPEQLVAVLQRPDLRGRPLIIEALVPFEKELSVIVARNGRGDVRTFPVVENIHLDGILHQTIAPARVDAAVAAAAEALAVRIAQALDLVGLLAIELFLTADGTLLVNELAPRPHNSGHVSLDACLTSQFEQHVRAVCGLPLGDPRLHTPAVMLNLLGQHVEPLYDALPDVLASGRCKLHLYGKKEARTGRKMGHLCLLAEAGDDAPPLELAADVWARVDPFLR